MNAQAPEIDDAERPRAAPMKFTYPTGARPLDGYTIKRGVGRGGFGEVYFATSDAGKEVALKLIRRNLDVELRGVTQCLNLKHPNLISLYDIRTDGMGDQWVVMEYVSGESLEDVIQRHPQGMPVDEALWWMRGISAGVSYLHDHGIVHRDLKPGNIFSDEGTVKIGDYGLAKFISCSRRSGQTESVGTVHYMAPEIANGRYGREIDTYALGIILFEMLTGHVPFEGESVGEVLMKHLTAEPDLSALSPPYRDIVERALAKDPTLRLKNVGELVELLPGSEGAPQPRQERPRPETSAEQAAEQSAQSQQKRPSWQDVNPFDGVKQAGAWNKSAPAAANASKADAKIEEPIWKAIREIFSSDGIHKARPINRAIALFAIVVLCVMYADRAMALAMPLFICYIVYYIIWTNINKRDAAKNRRDNGVNLNTAVDARFESSDERHTVAWPDPAATEAAIYKMGVSRSPLRAIRSTWRERTRQQLLAKPAREKFSELLGSMLMSALISSLAALGFVVVLMLRNQPASEQMASYLWLAAVGTIGSWAVLIPSKFFEGKIEDHAPIRISLLLLGTLVGLAAWSLSDVLMLKTPGWEEPIDVGQGLITHEMLGWPRGTASNVSPAIFVAYFAFLFLIPRWWRQTEYTRNSRLSLWSAFLCAGWAWLLHIFWWFPQPLGMMTAAVMAISIQLASPWMPPSKRRAISEDVT
jgi:serine/threonine protein kinase